MARIAYYAALLFVSLGLMWIAPDASAVKQPKSCGSVSPVLGGDGCGKGEFCQGPTCFFPPGGGTCVRAPQTCINIVKQVCGCDGQTYKNDCVRQQAKVSKAHDGRC